jgi:PAS domain S-box-containing protein
MSHLKLVTGTTSPHTTVYIEALEQLDTGMCIIDDDGAVLASNQQFCQLLGLPPEWPTPKAAGKTVSAAEVLVSGWLTRVEAQGDFAETVALSDQVTLQVEGRGLPSGGVSLAVTEVADADRQKLRDSEDRFRSAAETKVGTYYQSDLDGSLTYGGEIVAKLLGRTLAELNEAGWEDIHVAPGRRAEFLSELERTNGQVREFQAAFRHKSGKEVWLSSDTRYRYDDAGNPVGLEGVIRNITDQKQQELALCRTENSLKQVQRLAKIGYWGRSFVTGEQYWSDATFDFFGFEKGDVPEFETMMNRIHPEDQNLMADAMAAIYAGNAYQEFEFRVVSPSGSVGYLRDVLEVEFDSEGRPVRAFGVIQDVTEARLGEAALRASEARLHAVIDNTSELILLKGLDGRFQLAGKGFESAYGIPVDDVVGKTPREVFPGEFADRVVEQDARVIATGQALQEEFVAPFADGTEHVLLVSKFPVRDETGGIVGIGAINTDITERIADRRALSESEARIRSLLAYSPDAISLKDSEGRFQIVNEKAAEFLNLAAEEMRGHTIWDLLPDGDWQSSDVSDAQVLAGERAVVEDEIPVEIPGRGKCILHRTKFPVLDSSQQTVGVGTITHDVTEARLAENALLKSEEKFQAIFEQAGLGIGIVGRTGNFLDVNNAMAEMFGFTRDEMTGESIGSLTVDDDIERSRKQFEALLAKENDIARFEKKYLRKGSEPFEANLVSTAVFDQDGEFEFTVALIEDITERRKTESALRESEELLRSLTDNLPNALTIKDENGQFVFANPAVEQVFRISPEDFIGQTAHPVSADADWPTILLPDSEILSGERELSDEEVRFTLGDGTKRIIQVTKFPVRDAAGRPTKVGTICTDITESFEAEEALRESEGRFRALVDNLPAGVTLKDRHHNVLLANETIEEWFGIRPQEFLDEKFHDVMPSRQNSKFVEAQERVLETNATVETEIETTFVDGTEHQLQAIFFPSKAVMVRSSMSAPSALT